jgi:hypothetical protein
MPIEAIALVKSPDVRVSIQFVKYSDVDDDDEDDNDDDDNDDYIDNDDDNFKIKIIDFSYFVNKFNSYFCMTFYVSDGQK